MDRAFDFVNDLPISAIGFEVSFPLSVSDVSIDLLGAPELTSLRVDAGTVTALWPQEVVDPNETVRLNVSFATDSNFDPTRIVPHWFARSREASHEPATEWLLADARANHLGEILVRRIGTPWIIPTRLPVPYWEERANPAELGARNFFVAFESNVSPDQFNRSSLWPAERIARSKAVRGLTVQLTSIIITRIAKVHSEKTNPRIEPVVAIETYFSRFDYLSKLMFAITCEHFAAHRTDASVLFVDPLEMAFRRFAARKLVPSNGTVASLNCQPDSDFYFLFAEFALCAVRLGIDTAFWTTFLRAFLPSLQVFIETFTGTGYDPPLKWGEYSKLPWKPGRIESPSADRIRDELSISKPTDFEAIYESIVKRAFRP